MRVSLTLEMKASKHREQAWPQLWEDCLWTFERADSLGSTDLMSFGLPPGVDLRPKGIASLPMLESW